MKIKTGDNVRVIAGKDKGKEAKVMQVFPKLNRIVVEGINVATRHLSGGRGRQGQKITFPAPIHVSNVKVVSEKSGKSGRVGYKFLDKDGKQKKVRVLKVKDKTEDLE
jgi:large subunit ribosomal protein L24